MTHEIYDYTVKFDFHFELFRQVTDKGIVAGVWVFLVSLEIGVPVLYQFTDDLVSRSPRSIGLIRGLF